MRCEGNFQDDRTCDLCRHSALDIYIRCKKIYDRKSKCPYSMIGISTSGEGIVNVFCKKKGNLCDKNLCEEYNKEDK